MSSKVSALAVVGLSVVCIGLLLNQSRAVPRQMPVPENQKEGSIDVSSSVRNSYVANKYVVYVELDFRDKDKSAASSKLNETRQAVLDALSKMGLGEKDYSLLSATVGETMERKSPCTKNVELELQYFASQNIEVYLTKKELIEPLELALAQVSDAISVVTLGDLGNADSLEAEAVKEACKKAQQQATEYAKNVGVQVGKPLMVQGSSNVIGLSQSDSVDLVASVNATMAIGGENDSQVSYVKTSQREQKRFKADQFRASLEIKVQGVDKLSLYELVGKRREAVLELARSLDVPETDIEVLRPHIRTLEGWRKCVAGAESKPVEAHQKIMVRFLSKQKAAAFYTDLAKIENVLPGSVEPLLQNADSLRQEVSREASRKALTRAKTLAEGLGGTLDKIVHVTDRENLDLSGEYLDEVVYEETSLRSANFLGAESSIGDSVEVSSFIEIQGTLKF